MPRLRAATIREHRALTRRAMLGAAKVLIADAGTAQIPLGEIALAAGVGRTTLYDYFTDRDDLIATLVEEELPSVLGAIIDSVPPGEEAPQRLALLASRIVEFVVTDPVLGVILHRDIGHMSREAELRIRNAHADLAETMVALYYEGVDRGHFTSMPPDLVGRLIQDTIMSAARTVISAHRPAQRVASITKHLEAFLLGGLGYDPAGGLTRGD